MKAHEYIQITNTQLDEYIDLYKREYGVTLERARALTQLNMLISLVLSIALPEESMETLEKELEKGYTEDAVHKEKMLLNTI